MGDLDTFRQEQNNAYCQMCQSIAGCSQWRSSLCETNHSWWLDCFFSSPTDDICVPENTSSISDWLRWGANHNDVLAYIVESEHFHRPFDLLHLPRIMSKRAHIRQRRSSNEDDDNQPGDEDSNGANSNDGSDGGYRSVDSFPLAFKRCSL